MAKSIPSPNVSCTWKIENFSLCAQLHDEYICSSDIVIDSFGTTIDLNLYPRGYGQFKKFVSLDVMQRNVEYVRVYEGRDVILKVSIPPSYVSTNETVFFEELIFFKQNEGYVKVCAFPDLIKREMVMPTKIGDYIDIKLSINLLNIPVILKSWLYFTDVQRLSTDITKGLENSNFSDFVFKCSDGKEVKVNKAFFFARYPNLAKSFDLENSENISLNSDSRTLEVLIKYLYSGTINLLDLPCEIFEILDNNKLEHLQNLLLPIPCNVESRTSIHIQTTRFNWTISNFSTLEQNHPYYYYFSSNNLNWTKLRLKLYLTQNEKNYEFLALSLKRLFAEGAMSMQCQIKIYKSSYTRDFNYIFENKEDEIIIHNFIEKKFITDNKEKVLVSDILTIMFYVQLSNGGNSTRTYFSTLPTVRINHTNSVAKNVWALQEDLRKLYLNPKFTDVALYVRSRTFPAHKFILSARSPVFSKMFEHDTYENKTGKIVVEDFEADIVQVMLRYMYCGEIVDHDIDFDFASKIYAVADKYELLGLKKQCFFYFKETLSVGNVGKVLVLADTHYDAELKRNAQDFVVSHANEVLQSPDWNKLMSERLDLAADMLTITLKSLVDKK